MRIMKGYIAVLLLTAVISMVGIGVLGWLVAEAWGWAPEIKFGMGDTQIKNFFRVISIPFSIIGQFLFWSLWAEGEKYYEKYSVDVNDFTVEVYDNAYVIKLDNKAWQLNNWERHAFNKKLMNGGEVNFTQHYNVKKEPGILIKSI